MSISVSHPNVPSYFSFKLIILMMFKNDRFSVFNVYIYTYYLVVFLVIIIYLNIYLFHDLSIFLEEFALQ